jgi:Tol biopolymer transport system component
MKKICLTLFVTLIFSQLQIAFSQKPNVSVTLFRDSAESSAWCPYDSTLVAYNLLQSNGYYGIFLANVGPGNTRINERCFTCTNASLPGKNMAQPAFDPLGRYILFTAEKKVHSGSSATAIPGIGDYNDLWVMTINETKAYRLTTTPASGLSAMIEPYFSPNGKEVM